MPIVFLIAGLLIIAGGVGVVLAFSTEKVGLAVLGIALLLAGFAGMYIGAQFNRVDPGNVGLVIDYSKGTVNGQPHIETAPTGSYVFTTPTLRLVEYPVSQRTLTMIRQDKGDDSLTCYDKDGVPIAVNVTIDWRIQSGKEEDLYLLRPNATIEQIETDVVRRQARQALGPACGKFDFFAIHTGQAKVDLGLKYRESLSAALAPFGLQVDTTSIGETFLDQGRQELLNNRIKAQQEAETAAYQKTKNENDAKANKAKAEGDAAVAIEQARGQAESDRLKAEQQAAAIRTRADAEAEAIRAINAQIANSPAYIQYSLAQRWDGRMPEYLVQGATGTGLIFPAPPATPQK